MDILVFKTNITDLERMHDIEPELDVHPQILEWNVDLHDRDYILRVVAKNVAPAAIENILFNAGYYCEELL